MFEITVEKIEEKMVPKREYRQVSDTGGNDREKPGGGPRFDYVWEDRVEEVTTVIYTQKVEQLNISDIAAVVNGQMDAALDRILKLTEPQPEAKP